MNSDFVFTTSWDDGHPLDRKLADLLDKYELNGTFYVPRRNIEGRPVIADSMLVELASRFEVGGHTLDHKPLVALPESEQIYQICEGKKWQEDVIGKETTGFCYPCGEYTMEVRGLVEKAGYRYARTVENLTIDPEPDRYLMSTTLQLYPHARDVYIRNFIDHLTWRKIGALVTVLARQGLTSRLMSMFLYAQKHQGVFHLWGHSWEIEEVGAWQDLEHFFSFVNDRVSPNQCLNNRQVAKTMYDVV